MIQVMKTVFCGPVLPVMNTLTIGTIHLSVLPRDP